MTPIGIDPEVAEHVTLGVLEMDGLQNTHRAAEITVMVQGLGATLREQYETSADALELFKPARTLYRAIGLDPTKVRPSSEALIRRLIQGKGLYQVNSVVDVCNWCSAEFALPIGLYDRSRIRGGVRFRLGLPGETYQGIGKGAINVDGRYCLADDEGAFGNPSSDSDRTKIDLKTRDILFVVFAPRTVPTELVLANIRVAGERMVEYNGGEAIRTEVLE